MQVSSPGINPRRVLPALQVQGFNQILSSFEPRIRVMCRRHRGSHVQQDDLRQAARIALWRAMQTYNPFVGTPLEHYASRAIRRALAKEAMWESRHWEDRVEPHVGDLEGDIDPDDVFQGTEPPGDPCFDVVLLRQMNDWATTLPIALRRVYDFRHTGGLTQAEAAREMGVSQQRVSHLERKLAQLANVGATTQVH